MAEEMGQQRRFIMQQLRHVERLVNLARFERAEADRAESELQRLNQTHMDLDKAGIPEVMKSLFMSVIPVACYFIDLLLLSATTEAFASVLVGDNRFFLSAAKLAMPLLIIVLEFGAGIFRSDARRLIGDFGNGWVRFIAWSVAGVLITTAMISVTAATVLLPYLDSGETLSIGIALEAIALSAIAGVAHGTLCFGAESIHLALGMVVFMFRRGAIQRRTGRHRALQQRHEADIREGIVRYRQAFQTYNDTNSAHPIESGPFSVPAVELVNSLFGYELIRHINGQSGQSEERDRGTDPDPDLDLNLNGNSPEATSETEYLRTVLASRVQVEEAEVRP